jgi:hypothetical protein
MSPWQWVGVALLCAPFALLLIAFVEVAINSIKRGTFWENCGLGVLIISVCVGAALYIFGCTPRESPERRPSALRVERGR